MQDHIFTKADLGRLLLPCPECGSDLGHVPMCGKASPRKPGDPCDCAAMHAELTRLRVEVRAAERRGAERAMEWAWLYMHNYKPRSYSMCVNDGLADLFPAPATGTQGVPMCTSCGLRKEKCDGC